MRTILLILIIAVVALIAAVSAGLIDIRLMVSAYHGGSSAGAAKGAPKSNVGSIDDLPVFSASPFAEPAVIMPVPSQRGGNNKTMFILMGAVALLAVITAVLVIVVVLGGDDDKPAPPE
jgi:hypothetical protein